MKPDDTVSFFLSGPNETNNDDAFWGWGRDQKGENHLGKIWMALRAELQIK